MRFTVGRDWLKEILADCCWKGEAHTKGSVLQGRLSSWPRSWIQKLETHLVGNSVIIIAVFDHLITLPIIFDLIIATQSSSLKSILGARENGTGSVSGHLVSFPVLVKIVPARL